MISTTRGFSYASVVHHSRVIRLVFGGFGWGDLVKKKHGAVVATRAGAESAAGT